MKRQNTSKALPRLNKDLAELSQNSQERATPPQISELMHWHHLAAVRTKYPTVRGHVNHLETK